MATDVDPTFCYAKTIFGGLGGRFSMMRARSFICQCSMCVMVSSEATCLGSQPAAAA